MNSETVGKGSVFFIVVGFIIMFIPPTAGVGFGMMVTGAITFLGAMIAGA